ncbi:phytoene desaturase family protein [Halosegnis marinus]|uniref:Phytoene desaturase family protein n=1 Tax=Halosegnis marinus TaxID=3034023 RepID=A0ABD5ZL65_9EURY|nr:phytoene desaturase family protein [Halosegnis sp. DT85]
MSLTGTPVAVIGGGFGGLSTACYLADAGANVTVFEKNEQLGGRASSLHRDGFRFDMGPSWYLMPDVFERFFGHFGREPSDYYDLARLDPHYRIFFKGDQGATDGGVAAEAPGFGEHDGARYVDMLPDLDANVETFEAIEPGAGDALREYLDTSATHYETAMEHFVYEDRPRLRDWVELDVMRAAPIGLQLIGTMDDYVADYFETPKLRQIMQYTLVFLGGSPRNTPALYNMMSHVDFNMGVYYPEGADPSPETRTLIDDPEGEVTGLSAVVSGLVELGRELGVSYELNAPVAEIISRREGFELELAGGGRSRFDLVVSDADYAHTEQELLPEHARGYDADYWDERTYAPSAFLLYMGVEGDIDPLAHHTLVLPDDWDPHFDDIFDTPAWPDDPAYYVCAPSETDDTVAPEGHSNLFVLVPIAPGLEDGPEVREEYREAVLDDLATNTGVELRDRIVVEEEFSVSEFTERYNSMKGTALGMAHTLRQTALLRPPHRSKELDGLYFTGSYTTPGIGVPMCLISGEHTADAVLADRD